MTRTAVPGESNRVVAVEICSVGTAGARAIRPYRPRAICELVVGSDSLLVVAESVPVLQLGAGTKLEHLAEPFEGKRLLRVEAYARGAGLGGGVGWALLHAEVHVGPQRGDGERAGVCDAPRARRRR